MPITTQELTALEARINAKVASHDIAFALTVHFEFDRVNDPRNRPPITIDELEDLFDRLITHAYRRCGLLVTATLTTFAARKAILIFHV